MRVQTIPQINWREFNKRSDERLQDLQRTLLPKYADKVIAIDVESGGYVLGRTRSEAFRKFSKKFPGNVAFVARVDGGAVVKYSDRVSHESGG